MDTSNPNIQPLPVAIDDPIPVPRAKPFDLTTWLSQLCSTTGADLTKIPAPTIEAMVGQPVNEVNRLFFAWHRTIIVEPTTLNDDDKGLLLNFVTPTNSLAYRTAKDNALRYEREANASAAMVRQQLQLAAQYYTIMRGIEGRASVDLWPKVQDILKDNWYSLDIDSLREGNVQEGIIFNTPRVQLTQYNAAAGIEEHVDMGHYKVRWIPQSNTMSVLPGVGNLRSGGYCHPHVSSSGEVCWGNAHDTYTRSMREVDPAPAFEALWVILQSFNAESPYRDLVHFKQAREVVKVAQEDRPIEFTEFPDEAWIGMDSMPDSWATTYEQDDRVADEGGREYLMTVFIKTYADTGYRVDHVDEDVYYVKHRNGRYHEVHADEIIDWN